MFHPLLKSLGCSVACAHAIVLGCAHLSRLHADQIAFAGCETPRAGVLLRRPPKACELRCRTLRIVETPNLRIHGFGQGTDAARWADECERLRLAICETWLGRRLPEWSPKCEIFLHATLGDYLRAVGADQASTVGASSLERKEGRVVLRRIDIRADREGWFHGALAHELTHVILADEFVPTELPLWADEGMAVMADPTTKQALHLRDLFESQRRGSSRRLVAFLADESAPGPAQIPDFYGQSLSLVKFLADRKTPADFVRFLHRARQVGYDAALGDCYDLAGVADLERQWQRSTLAAQPTNPIHMTAFVSRPADRLASPVRP